MKNPNDPLHVALETAMIDYEEANTRLAPILAEAATKKAALLAALGEVVIQFVKEHGKFYEGATAGKKMRHTYKRWHRGMECSTMVSRDGFEDLINATFGHIKWEEFYRPALEALDNKKAVFLFGMGDCAVVLNEEISTLEMEEIVRVRHGMVS